MEAMRAKGNPTALDWKPELTHIEKWSFEAYRILDASRPRIVGLVSKIPLADIYAAAKMYGIIDMDIPNFVSVIQGIDNKYVAQLDKIRESKT